MAPAWAALSPCAPGGCLLLLLGAGVHDRLPAGRGLREFRHQSSSKPMLPQGGAVPRRQLLVRRLLGACLLASPPPGLSPAAAPCCCARRPLLLAGLRSSPPDSLLAGCRRVAAALHCTALHCTALHCTALQLGPGGDVQQHRRPRRQLLLPLRLLAVLLPPRHGRAGRLRQPHVRPRRGGGGARGRWHAGGRQCKRRVCGAVQGCRGEMGAGRVGYGMMGTGSGRRVGSVWGRVGRGVGQGVTCCHSRRAGAIVSPPPPLLV